MRKIVLLLMLTGMLVFGMGTANAMITVKFDPAYKYAGIGSTFAINILADIPQTDATVGWGFNLVYDQSLMSLQGASGGLGWDLMQLGPDNLTALLIPDPNSPESGVTGDDLLLATLNFECLGPGSSWLDITTDPNDPLTGFVKGPFDPTAGPTFADWQSQPGMIEQGDAVPEPSTFLLLGSGLAGIAWLRRRKSRTS